MTIVKEIDKLRIFSYEIVKVIILYCLGCIVSSVIVAIIKTLVYIVCDLSEKIIEKLEKIVIGENSEKSLKYGCGVLWFLKFEADVEFFVDWIKYDIVKTYTVVSSGYSETKTSLYWAEKLSLDNFIQWINRVRRYFFCFTYKNLFIFALTLYYVLRNKITQFVNDYLLTIDFSKLGSENILDIVQISTTFVAICYIIFDVKYKASASFALREERFKKLILLEEKLMVIIQEMSYVLENNIEELCNKKCVILSQGATELSGMECYVSKDKIELCEEMKYRGCDLTNRDIFDYFDDLQKGFDELKEFSAEYKKSSLNFSNIYLIDCETMLTKVGAFWDIWGNNLNYKDVEFMGKNSMQTWYLNFFPQRVLKIDGEKRYYDKNETIRIVYEASAMLDYKLKRAFVLKLYLRKYERQMVKRLKKINRFSKIHM